MHGVRWIIDYREAIDHLLLFALVRYRTRQSASYSDGLTMKPRTPPPVSDGDDDNDK
jgi:hypothetical protein